MLVDLQRIKAERMVRGLTQEDMARKLGWHDRSSYSRREQGITPLGADELIRIAEILDCTNDMSLFFKLDVPKKEQ
ncbi:helix-turn-helix transcriptional regulator [Pediococcus pentosaceus]|uniref:helix-turn-helix domain-containing protein n=1 Tax=Pediococcus pentosaceus TaxID=1255 RepID=UPI001C1EAF00|nr:helix-turn-helix transcriptional regulator [Pediococcus pentosaceus]MBU7002118.1 helix-turn-helix transcriptional regulator [Pediococcus pentosaceus]MCG9227390.1 helix-turn-helix domain-containing protein [Pediococcus pentosaceus]MDA8037473.1 helix-turn-helix domain-containing protein [Pediococcus pentosaceus]